MRPEELVVIARLGRPHGVRGAVRVLPTGPTLETLHPGMRLVARGSGGERELVLSARSGAPPHVALSFEGVETRDAAAGLSGMELLAPEGALPDLDDEDTFYVRELLGCAVVVGGREIGVVTDVHAGAANDALEMAGEGGVVLIPFTADAVLALDLQARRIVVREDLLEGSA
jgi:16S rRNA processing protein RimM